MVVKQFTLKQLYQEIGKTLKNKPHLANKYVCISEDSEGNGFHGLFYGITEIGKGEEDLYPITDSVEENIENIVILG